MVTYANMISDPTTVYAANDSIVIRKYGSGIIGGHTLDCSALPDGVTCVKAGHWIIQSTTDETIMKPMPLAADGASYGTLPDGYKYVGVARSTIPVDDARCPIMYAGEVNDVASPYSFTDAQKTAFLGTAGIQIVFLHD